MSIDMSILDDQLKKRFKSALINANGLIVKAINELGVTNEEEKFEIRKWAKDDPDIAEMVKVLRFELGDKLTDLAVSKFALLIENGDPKAIELLLFKSCFGRERGFGENINVNIGGQPTGLPIIIYHEVTETNNAKAGDTQPDTPEAEGLSAS